MATYQPRFWEDYQYGSSDSPRCSRQIISEHRRIRLEEHLERISLKFLNPDRTTDVVDTNNYKINYALENGLRPVIRRPGGEIFYRHVSKDGDGVLQFRYETKIPQRLVSISEKETIPIEVAALYTEATKEEIRELIRREVLRGSSKVVNLEDLNQYSRK